MSFCRLVNWNLLKRRTYLSLALRIKSAAAREQRCVPQVFRKLSRNLTQISKVARWLAMHRSKTPQLGIVILLLRNCAQILTRTKAQETRCVCDRVCVRLSSFVRALRTDAHVILLSKILTHTYSAIHTHKHTHTHTVSIRVPSQPEEPVRQEPKRNGLAKVVLQLRAPVHSIIRCLPASF